MVFNVCIGTLALLAYEAIDQAVTGIDLTAGTFTFTDRADFGLSLAEIRNQLFEYVYPEVPI